MNKSRWNRSRVSRPKASDYKVGDLVTFHYSASGMAPDDVLSVVLAVDSHTLHIIHVDGNGQPFECCPTEVTYVA